jgi:hypothetical protein
MTFRDKRIADLRSEDVSQLVSEGIREARHIEYKLQLPGGSDRDKKKFLADVSSFANSEGGGDLIYGVAENDGVPTSVEGLSQVGTDAQISRLQNLIRDGVAPRISGVEFHPIEVKPDRVVIVVRVSASWARPHMVTLGGSSRFFSRNSNGRFQLDVAEIRSAFLLSARSGDRIREYRLDRVAAVTGGETPASIRARACAVLHILPASSGNALSDVFCRVMENAVTDLLPFTGGSWNYRFNFDGFLVYSHGKCAGTSYTQLTRDGGIEVVDGGLLAHPDAKQLIPGIAFEQKILDGLRRYLSLQRKLGLSPPIVVMLSLTGVKGFTMAVGSSSSSVFETYPVDRDILLLPDVLLVDYAEDIGSMMRPAFDAVWNAAGWPGSLNYDEAGKWNPNRG